jgi:hypothetical protein
MADVRCLAAFERTMAFAMTLEFILQRQKPAGRRMVEGTVDI